MSKDDCKYFIGIDISKESFDVSCINAGGEKIFHISTSMDRAGFQELTEKITSLSCSQEAIHIGMESTACYHINLYSFLISSGYTVMVINPVLIANFLKLHLRKTKTDRKDAFVIAQFLVLNKTSLRQTNVSAEIADLKDLVRQRESIVDQITALKAEIKRVLTITFPELERTACIFTKSMLRLLCEYPSAYAIRNTKRSRIAKILIPGSMGKQTPESVNRIKKAAETSIGTSSPMKELILKQKASLLAHMEGNLQELTDILIELCQSQMHEDMNILTSLPGIGNKTAMNFLIEMGGGIKPYQSHKKLIAMAGIDPALYQSGKVDRSGRISKRGNRHLRRVIWLMTVKVIQFTDRFKQYHEKRRRDGLPYKKAVLATAHKLIRVLFTMLKKQNSV